MARSFNRQYDPPDPALVAALEQLIAKWRKEATCERLTDSRIWALRDCANDLSALLAASRPADEPVPGHRGREAKQ